MVFRAIKGVMRRAALAIPPVRRLQDDMRRLHEMLVELQRANGLLRQQLDRETAASETAAKQRDELELRLYVMRSDLNRAMIRSEEFRGALRQAERLLEELRAERDPRAPRCAGRESGSQPNGREA
jgi:hypothetical protein